MMSEEERRRRFERALHYAGDTHTVADVIAKVRKERAKFWQEGDTVVVTELLDYPRLRAVNYWLVAGHLSDCFALQDQIEPWALEQGCSVAVATARSGWLRVCHRFGWQLRAHQFAKELRR